jgi:hypothetical protein
VTASRLAHITSRYFKEITMRIEKLGNNKTRLNTGTASVYFSYNTPVVLVKGKQVYVTEDYYSKTTSRHITEFLTFEDFEGRVINKIPTAKIEEML